MCLDARKIYKFGVSRVKKICCYKIVEKNVWLKPKLRLIFTPAEAGVYSNLKKMNRQQL